MSSPVINKLPLLWKKRWFRVFVFIGILSVTAVLYTVELTLQYINLYNVVEIPLVPIISRELSYWYSWGLFLPVIFWLCRRYRIDSQRWLKHSVVHIFAAVIISVAHLFVYISVVWFLENLILDSFEPPGDVSWITSILRGIAVMSLQARYLVYWVILFIYHAVYYYKRAKDNEVRSSLLEAKLMEAKLEALKMQIHPHFLFNTLHSISSLMHKDLKAADTMISKLGDFLRMTLDRSEVQELPLKEELELLERYVEIEQIRFGDRLRVEYRIDPVLLDAYVPNLIFQPLVENAIAHGISTKPGGEIVISGKRKGDYLHLSVTDNGRGMPVSEHIRFRFKQGIGLSNTQERLQQLYDGNHVFTIVSNEKSGFSVKLQIPYRTRPFRGDNGGSYESN
jgi:two-component system, LytTR family, sensor kinase